MSLEMGWNFSSPLTCSKKYKTSSDVWPGIGWGSECRC